MNKNKIVHSIVFCLVIAVTLTVTFWVASVLPSNVYHIGDIVTDHWEFVGYMIGGGFAYPKEGANFDNTQTGDVVSFDVLIPNVTVTLGNHTYICTAYYAPPSWYGPDPSTITLKRMN